MFSNEVDVEKRFIRLFEEEAKVTARERALAKRTAKLRNRFDLWRTEFEKQQAILSEHKKYFEKLQTDLKALKQLRDEMQSRLKIKQTIVEQLKAEVTQRTAAWAAERKEQLKAQSIVHMLKEATNIHINCHALPEVVQGVVLCENGASTVWRPFKLNPLQFKQREIQDIIWENSNIENKYQEKWQEIIFGKESDENTT